MNIYKDNNKSILKIHGDDAAAFLQGLISIDITTLSERSRFFVILDAFGFVKYEGFIIKHDAIFYLEVSDADEIISFFNKYKIRKKVLIEKLNYKVYYILPDEIKYEEAKSFNYNKEEDEFKVIDGRSINIIRIYTNKDMNVSITEKAWEEFSYKNGLFNSKDILSEQIPHSWGYEMLGAFDYDKGCYLGQEKINSIKRLSNIKSHILPCKIIGSEKLNAGDKFKVNGKTIKIGSVSKDYCFALVPSIYLGKEIILKENIKIHSFIPLWYELDKVL